MRRNFFSKLLGLLTQSDILICGNRFRLEISRNGKFLIFKKFLKYLLIRKSKGLLVFKQNSTNTKEMEKMQNYF